MCATHKNLDEMIATAEFRDDLFYRLNTLEFRVPSLNERLDDIVPLAEYFIHHYATKYHKAEPKLSDCAQQALLEYRWPGNIRELSHLMERAVLLFIADPQLATSDLQLTANELPLSASKGEQALPLMTLEKAEIKLIKQALGITNSSVPQAAKLLGLTKSSLYRRLEKYEHEFPKK